METSWNLQEWPYQILLEMGFTEPELSIFYNEISLQVEALGYLATNFLFTICPAYKICWFKGGTELVK